MSGLDVVGGAVGIASLGIQVCQGLLSYYDGWKSYNTDIRSAYEAVADLSKTLGLLKDSLGRDQLDQERADRVTACLQTCVGGLIELSSKSQELRKHSTPDGFREKVLQKAQRAWYPFRTETLAKLRENVESVQGRLLLALQVLQLDTALALETSLARMSLQQQSDSFATINSWLSPPDPWTNHAAARKRHEPQTGDWLLQSNKYQRWKAGTSRHLWISGKAGCGKTVLCSTVVEQVQLFCSITPRTVFAVFYFAFSDARKQKYEDLLRSLVLQLGSKDPGLSTVLQAHQKTPGRAPALDELEDILHSIISKYDRVFLLLDALDESPEKDDERDFMLEHVEEIVDRARNVSLFVTSRDVEAIRSTFENIQASRISIEDHSVDSDIQLYILSEISKHSRLRRLSDDLKSHIGQTLTQKSNGMFRWAYCQLQELKKLRALRPTDINEVLDDLPSDLDETYERMLVGIAERERALALALLRWLAYSRRPLTLVELSEAAIVDPDSTEEIAFSERGSLEDTLDILRDLVVVEVDAGTNNDTDSPLGSSNTYPADDDNVHESGRIVKLAHFSIKEYLESERAQDGKANYAHLAPGPGHHFLAQSCLTYLLHYSEASSLTLADHTVRDFPLLDYAAEYSFEHSKLQQPAETRREMKLLLDIPRLNIWRPPLDTAELRFYLYLHFDIKYQDAAGRMELVLFCASWLGMSTVISTMLQSPVPFDRTIASSQALSAAVRGNHAEIVDLLLQLGANPNYHSEKTFHETALERASINGQVDIVRLLLDHGANANVVTTSWTPLIGASSNGRLEIVQVLLDRKADPNLAGHEHVPLTAAYEFCHLGIMESLLAHGADVNLRSNDGRTALQAACVRCHLAGVRLLLGHGADPNVNTDQDGTALLAVIVNFGDPDSKLEIIKLLLDHGADPDIASGEQNFTPLEEALYQEDEQFIGLLRSRGAKEPESNRWEDLLREHKGNPGEPRRNQCPQQSST